MNVSSKVYWGFSLESGWSILSESQDDSFEQDSLEAFQIWCDRQLLQLRSQFDVLQAEIFKPGAMPIDVDLKDLLFEETVRCLGPGFEGNWTVRESPEAPLEAQVPAACETQWQICLVGDDPHFAQSETLQTARQAFLDQVSQVFSHQVGVMRSMQRLLVDCQTFQRDNQELQQISQLKSEFLANTSHEIRTPLSSILGFTHLLREQGFNPGAVRHQEYLRIILTSGQHLLSLINDILDLSKIEANQLDLNWEIVEIAPLCQTIVMLVQEKANDRGLQLKLEIVQPAQDLYCDPLRLKQMLFNLLSNALKFTKVGTVGLRVEQDDRSTHFTVWDTGVGIPEDQLNLLFRPYQQLPHTATPQAEGTGLGLALTQKLAELHHGTVRVNSELDRGSRFTVSLPILSSFMLPTDVQNPAIIPVPLQQLPLDQRRLSSQILLVEDNADNAQLLIAYLCKLGYEVTWAKNHTDLWQSLRADRCPALILMDINLPGVDGLTIIRELRQQPAYGALPIIAQTAMAMSGDRAVCLEAGATEYLTKPLDLNRLAQVLNCYSEPQMQREQSGE